MAGWFESRHTDRFQHCSLLLRQRDGRIASPVQRFYGRCQHVLHDRAGAVIMSQGSLRALDAEGRQIWEAAPGLDWQPATPPVRASDGSVWVAASSASVVRLSGSDGSELARSPPLAGDGKVVQLRAAADGGVQALVEGRNGAPLLTAVATDGDGRLLRTLELASAQARSCHPEYSDSYAASGTGLGGVWLEHSGGEFNALHGAVLDEGLALRWSARLATVVPATDCTLALSAAGRMAVHVDMGSAAGGLLRVDTGGRLVEDVAPLVRGTLPARDFVFSNDESLWLSSQPASSTGEYHLLRFAGDVVGVARSIPLVMAGQQPRALQLAARPDGSAELLASTEDYAAPVIALRVAHGGLRPRPPVPRMTRQARFIEVADGWVMYEAPLLQRLDFDGRLHWQREVGLLHPNLLACSPDAACVFLQSTGSSSQVEWLDPQGQAIATQALPPGHYGMQLQYQPRSQRLYLLSVATERFHLYEVNLGQLALRIDLPRQQLLSFPIPVDPRIAPSVQLVQLPFAFPDDAPFSDLVPAFGASGLLWQLQADRGHLVGAGLGGSLWLHPGDPRFVPAPVLAPLDAMGQRRWTLPATPWQPLAAMLPGQAGYAELNIAGQPERTSWIASGTSSGLDRYALRIVAANGRERLLELPDASGPIAAIATSDDDESAVIAYPVRAADQPRLRIRRVVHPLFRDGLEG